MTPAFGHIPTLACAAALAGPALAQEADSAATLDAWIADRAAIFSDVCMASAPKFDRLGELAETAGLEKAGEEWTFPPEVFLSLREFEDTCACFMSMGAPEPARLIVGVVDRINADYPGEVRPDDRPGTDYAAFYDREGESVRVVLNFETFKELTFLAGFVIAEGGCPV